MDRAGSHPPSGVSPIPRRSLAWRAALSPLTPPTPGHLGLSATTSLALRGSQMSLSPLAVSGSVRASETGGRETLHGTRRRDFGSGRSHQPYTAEEDNLVSEGNVPPGRTQGSYANRRAFMRRSGRQLVSLVQVSGEGGQSSAATPTSSSSSSTAAAPVHNLSAISSSFVPAQAAVVVRAATSIDPASATAIASCPSSSPRAIVAPALRYVPKALQSLLIDTTKTALKDIISSFQSLAAWEKFFSILGVGLQRPVTDEDGRSSHSVEGLKDRIQAIGKGEALLDPYFSFHLRPHTRPADPATRATKLCEAGEFSRARMVLENTPFAPRSAETFESLLGKHPQLQHQQVVSRVQSAAEWGAQLPPPGTVLEESFFRRVLSKAPRLSGGGPSGIVWEHFVFLCRKDKDVFGLIFDIAARVARGDLTGEARQLLLLGRLHALAKEGGDVRPIVVGEVLVRWISSALALQYRPVFHKILQPLQVGVASKGGLDVVLRELKTLSALHPTEIIIGFDVKNAFNSVSRACILKAVRDSVPSVFPYVAFLLADCSKLIYDGDNRYVISSAEGVRQGDSLSPALFSLAIHSLLKSLSVLRGVRLVRAWADDISALVTDVESGVDAMKHLEASLLSVGLSLNYSKCVAFCADRSIDMSLLGALGVRVSNEGLIVLGVPLGSPSFIRAELQRILDSHAPLLTRVSDFPRSQLAFQLLSYCCASRINHLTRVCDSLEVSAAAEVHDQAIIKTLLKIVGSSQSAVLLHPATVALIHQPIQYGGLGLRATATVVDAAQVASLHAAWPLLSEETKDAFRHQGAGVLEDVLQARSAFDAIKSIDGPGVLTAYETLDDLLEDHEASGLNRSALDAGADAIENGWKISVQKALTGIIEKKIRDDTEAILLEEVSTKQPWSQPRLAHYQSVAGLGTGSWLLVLASHEPVRLTNEQFAVAVRYRLGITETTTVQLGQRGIRCSCAANRLLDEPDGGHIYDCKCGKQVDVRHDQLTRAVRAMLAQAGFRSVPEPQLDWGDNKRADIATQLQLQNDQMTLIDVSVVRGEAPSHLAVTMKGFGSAAAGRELEKHKKYDALAAGAGHIFIPFVMEHSGFMGSEAQQFVDRVASLAEPRINLTGRTKAQFKNYWLRRIGILIQKFSANILLLRAEWYLSQDLLQRRGGRDYILHAGGGSTTTSTGGVAGGVVGASAAAGSVDVVEGGVLDSDLFLSQQGERRTVAEFGGGVFESKEEFP